MKILKTVTTSVLCASLFLLGAVAHAGMVNIDPRATYFLTSNDNVPGAAPILLSDHDIFAGDTIQLDIFGGYDNGPGSEDSFYLTAGVFSSSADLLASSVLNRVTGAIDAGIDLLTYSTYFNGLPTDIAEDFGIGRSVTISVPTGALYLFVSPSDILFSDNSDLNNNYEISLSVSAVPVPAAVWLFGSGLIGLIGVARCKKA